MDKSEMAEFLSKHFEPWPRLSPDEQEGLLQNTRFMSFEKGASIHNGDNDCLGVLFVKSGMLRVYMLSEEGRRLRFPHKYRRNLHFVRLLRSSSITFDVHIDAEEYTEALIIGAPYFSVLPKTSMFKTSPTSSPPTVSPT